jgi:hypothetical protein
MYKLAISNLLILVAVFAYGRKGTHSHDASMDDHRNHIGIAVGPVYLFSEKEYAPGLHIHYSYLYEIGNIHVGSGLGFEAILDEHRHYTTSINFSYFPIHNLTLTVAPGVLFSKGSSEFTTHFESSYEFILNKFHIGPVVEYAHAAQDNHFMIGLHTSYGF